MINLNNYINLKGRRAKALLPPFALLRQLKDVLEKERKEVEREGIRVVVNGKMEIEEIQLNPQMDIEKQEKLIKDCINEAMKQIQQEAAQKMFQG